MGFSNAAVHWIIGERWFSIMKIYAEFGLCCKKGRFNGRNWIQNLTRGEYKTNRGRKILES
jgi:hypothetical protein